MLNLTISPAPHPHLFFLMSICEHVCMFMWGGTPVCVHAEAKGQPGIPGKLSTSVEIASPQELTS